jgi:lysine N6-hydroxylase
METYDIIGVGAGPANLSLAALATNLKNINAVFIEKREEFIWHVGMLLPDAKLQVPFLNDLVTLADPTNNYSFLNYLSTEKRLYQFISANYNPLTRAEFNQYFKWVFNKLTNIKKGEEALKVNFDGDNILVKTSKAAYQTKNLVIATGQAPYIPNIFKNYLTSNVYHSSQYMNHAEHFSQKRIAVIGGGQSGAEIFNSLLANDKELPREIFWISKRANFSPLDDTPFTSEIFTPTFINYFHSLEKSKKDYFISTQLLANQGISEYTAQDIYRKLYELRFIKQSKSSFYLLPSHEFIAISKVNDEYNITISDLITGTTKVAVVDKIILCTGYSSELPAALSDLQPMLKYDNNGLVIDKSYKVIWEGMDTCSLYIQNGAQHTHGISDSTLSIAAYRSATILNNIVGKAAYPNIEDSSMINWGWGSNLESSN